MSPVVLADAVSNKMTTTVDDHLGRRLRQRRRSLGLTQRQLADVIGVRFQQVQKYESGVNRISAVRLWRIARVLQTPVEFFFEGLAHEACVAEIQDVRR